MGGLWCQRHSRLVHGVELQNHVVISSKNSSMESVSVWCEMASRQCQQCQSSRWDWNLQAQLLGHLLADDVHGVTYVWRKKMWPVSPEFPRLRMSLGFYQADVDEMSGSPTVHAEICMSMSFFCGEGSLTDLVPASADWKTEAEICTSPQ